MTREPLLYICMPYRQGRYSTKENIARAAAVARYYAAQGYPVLLPHAMSPEVDPFNRLGHEYWLSTTLAAMEGCDVVVCGPGWQESEGCRGERERADELGLEVWEFTEHTFDDRMEERNDPALLEQPGSRTTPVEEVSP
jgi:hypothetical protein